MEGSGWGRGFSAGDREVGPSRRGGGKVSTGETGAIGATPQGGAATCEGKSQGEVTLSSDMVLSGKMGAQYKNHNRNTETEAMDDRGGYKTRCGKKWIGPRL